MMLGADWLEDHSPMLIHWKKKLLKFTYNNKRISLKGVKDEARKCAQVSNHKLKGLLKKKAVTHVLEVKAICPLDQTVEPQDHLMTMAPSADQLPPPAQQSLQIPSEIESLLLQY